MPIKKIFQIIQGMIQQMMKIKNSCILLFFVFACTTTFAQKPSTFENWFSIGLQKKVENFTFTLEEGYRIREFYLSRQNYTDLNIEYKFNKFLQASAGYRLALKNSMFNISEVNHRFYFDLTGNLEAGDNIELSLRSRYQYTSLGQEDDIVLPSESYFRNRIKARVKFNKDFSLGPAYEMFVIITPGQDLITENRLALEAQYRINKKNIISLGYILRSYIQIENPMNIHIISLDYVFKF